jgi:hypothetical protein
MLINEVKAMSLNIGDTFTMSDDLGNFKKGEEVTVDDIKISGMDFVVTLSNKNGNTDTFYFDRDDEI